MKKILLAIASALLLLGAAGEAFAARGSQFCPEGMSGPGELAVRMEKALAADATGTTVRLEKCLATPQQFLFAWQQEDPAAGLTDVSQLPGYIRSLVVNENLDREIEYHSACIAPNGDVIINCESRPLKQNENVYKNPKTGKNVLLQSCVNPGGTPNPPITVAPEPCVEAWVPVGPHGHAVRDAIFSSSGPLPEASVKRCLAYMRVGETTWTPGWVDECAWGEIKLDDGRVTNCTMAPATATIGKPVERRGGFLLYKRQGWLKVRLPPELARMDLGYHFWICHEEQELIAGHQYPEIRHMKGQYTTPDDFVREADGVKRARFPTPNLGTKSIAFSPPQEPAR